MGNDIKSVRYHWGLTNDHQRIEALVGVEFRGKDIPADVLDAIAAEGILRLDGTRGEPSVGTPVEVDDLVVKTEGGVTRIRVYNRGIHVLSACDEGLTRIHRVCCMLQRFLPRPETPRVQAWHG